MYRQRSNQEDISIFWDYDSTRWTSAMSTTSNYDIVKNIREAIKTFGAIKSIRSYADFSSEALPRSTTIRSELSSSGVTLVDCPGDGRKDLNAKIMIVDILIHAWDHPPPYTFVLITGDRDLAYAVSTLRTRGYRVIVVSPSTTHTDITAQATLHLDWTRVILGLGGGDINGDTPPGNFSSAPRNLSSSQQRQKPEGQLGNTFGSSLRAEEQVINPLASESRKPYSRNNSLFSYHDPQRFDIFGNINEEVSIPETTRNAFGFGDGPLFPRPASQTTKMRADSAPPNIRHSSVMDDSSHVSRSSQSSTENLNKGDNMPLSAKGKERDTETTKSTIPEVSWEAVPARFSYSAFGSFGNFTAPLDGLSASPPPVELHSQQPDSSSTSFRSSTPSNFSMNHHDHANMSTAPTSAIPPVASDKGDSTSRQATVLHGSSNSVTTETPSMPQGNAGSASKGVQVDSKRTANQSPSTTNGGVKAGTSTIDSVTSQLHPLTPSRKVSDPPKNVAKKESPVQTPRKSQSPALPPPPRQTSTPRPAGPSTQVLRPRSSSTLAIPPQSLATPPQPLATPPQPLTIPPQFSTLVSVLREQRPKIASISRTALGALLVKKDPNVYKKAGCSKFSTYIAAAVKAGIIQETVNGHGDQCISLHATYV